MVYESSNAGAPRARRAHTPHEILAPPVRARKPRVRPPFAAPKKQAIVLSIRVPGGPAIITLGWREGAPRRRLISNRKRDPFPPQGSRSHRPRPPKPGVANATIERWRVAAIGRPWYADLLCSRVQRVNCRASHRRLSGVRENNKKCIVHSLMDAIPISMARARRIPCVLAHVIKEATGDSVALAWVGLGLGGWAGTVREGWVCARGQIEQWARVLTKSTLADRKWSV